MLFGFLPNLRRIAIKYARDGPKPTALRKRDIGTESVRRKRNTLQHFSEPFGCHETQPRPQMSEKEQINLFALSLEQLNSLKQSIEEELQGLQGAIQQLQVSRNKLQNSKEALKRLGETPEGTEMLVPITSSLYVPGETTALETVIVDVGTGEPPLPLSA